MVDLPAWNGPEKFGTRVRIALWLMSEVGVGCVFTKAQLRAAFPDVAQADRRMRELRSSGWRIDTKREDPRLGANEQRFVAAGDEIWIPGQSTAKSSRGISAPLRRRIMAADGYMCTACGICAGDKYDGSIETAQLDIARRTVVMPGGLEEVQLVTECKRCRVGASKHQVDLPALLKAVAVLTKQERHQLLSWVTAGERTPSPVDKIWAQYRGLPTQARTLLEDFLATHDS